MRKRAYVVSNILYVIGILTIIAGIVIGLIELEQPVPGYQYVTETHPELFFAWFITGLVTGMLLIGFSEIIRLLQEGVELLERQNGVEDD